MDTSRTLRTPPAATDAAGNTPRLAVVSASVRTERLGVPITGWVVDGIRRHGGFETDVIDLATVVLPDDRLMVPGGSQPTEVSERIAAADAFVLITPEYNHSYPAPLKRLLDWHLSKWQRKPVSIVAYGSRGGHAASEHLRGVLAELGTVGTRNGAWLTAPWEHLDDAGGYAPGDRTDRALDSTLAELAWWSAVLSEARAHRPFPA